MLSVVKSAGATVANGALQFVYQNSGGRLTNVFAVSFQILNSELVQIFPSTPGNEQSATSNNVGTGRYNGVWTPGTEAVGQYFVRWFYQVTSSSAEETFDQEFELVLKTYPGRNYCAVYDLRAEGLTTETKSDADAQKLIARASGMIERITGRRFLAEYRAIEVDGRGGRALLLMDPIVAVEKIVQTYAEPFSSSLQELDLSNLRVFNRHLTQNLNSPDDRNNPKLEWVHGEDLLGVQGNQSIIFSDFLFWPRGVRNIQITGIFGYTEPDGSKVGKTPEQLRDVCKWLCFRYASKMSVGGPGPSASQVVSDSTRDQSVTYAQPAKVGAFTGDWEIDSILLDFMRPPMMGAA